jgi:hypothetical protein
MENGMSSDIVAAFVAERFKLNVRQTIQYGVDPWTYKPEEVVHDVLGGHYDITHRLNGYMGTSSIRIHDSMKVEWYQPAKSVWYSDSQGVPLGHFCREVQLALNDFAAAFTADLELKKHLAVMEANRLTVEISDGEWNVF